MCSFLFQLRGALRSQLFEFVSGIVVIDSSASRKQLHAERGNRQIKFLSHKKSELEDLEVSFSFASSFLPHSLLNIKRKHFIVFSLVYFKMLLVLFLSVKNQLVQFFE